MNKQNKLTKFYLRRKINLLAEYLGRRDDPPASLHDPIYSEGWTIGPVGRPRQLEQDSPADKQQAEEEKPSGKQD